MASKTVPKTSFPSHSVSESEKNTLLQELNKARNFETGLFSTKQKEFENKINERKYDIEELEGENYFLQEQINKKNERLEYKDKIINNSNNILKEAKNKINRLAAKLQNLNKMLLII